MLDDLIHVSRTTLSSHTPRVAAGFAAREAAVLVLIYRMAGRETLLLTRRTDKVDTHKGQISFPGGGRDGEHEDLATTALREAHEEVGVHPHDVELIGRLDEVITTSSFRVAPFVGVLKRAPYAFVPSPHEVAEVIEAPLRHLLHPASKVIERRAGLDGTVVHSPAYHYGGHRIWGATARMLEGFLDLIQPR